MSRTRWPLSAFALIALLSLAGCASANPPAASSSISSSGNTNFTNHEQAVKFAECIRDHGVSEFPDPDASGEFIYGIKRGSSLDPSTAAWQKAIGACKNLEPPGFIPKKLNAAQMRARLRFAQCMRDNGVRDFPDPTANGPLIAVKGAHSIPGFQVALQKCRDTLTGAVGGQ